MPLPCHDMDYVDDLFKEYLLFRGFTETLHSFSREKLTDKGSFSWQADAIYRTVFAQLISQHDFEGLVELFRFLRSQVFSKLPTYLEEQGTKLEASLLRLCLVRAIEDGKQASVTAFFQKYGEDLRSSPEAVGWEPWFAMPFLPKPQKDPQFQVFFTKPWRQLLEVSFRNFMTEAFQKLPLPAVLRFDTDRRIRQALQKKVDSLQTELIRMGGRPVMRTIESEAEAPGVPGSSAASGAPSSAGRGIDGREGDQVAEDRMQVWSLTDMLDPDYLEESSLAMRGAASLEMPEKHEEESPRLALGASEAGSGLQRPQEIGEEAEAQVEEWGLAEDRSQTDARQSSHDGGIYRLGEAGAIDSKSQEDRPLHDAPLPLQSQVSLARRESGGGGGAVASLGIRHEVLHGHESAITEVVFSGDGRNLASASADGIVRICAPDSLDGNASRSAVLMCGAPVSRLAWDTRADKVMLVGTRGKGVKAWHVDQKRMVAHVKADPAVPDVAALACSPTEPSFLCACSGGEQGSPQSGRLALWNLRSFRKVHTYKMEPPIASATFSTDGCRIAACGYDGQLRLFDTNTSMPTAHISICQSAESIGASDVCFTGADGGANLLTLTPNGTLRLWDVAMLRSGSPVWEADMNPYLGSTRPSGVRIVPSPQGRAVAFTSDLCEPHVMRLPSGGGDGEEPLVGRGFGHAKPVTAVTWHPSLNVLASGSLDRSINVSHLTEW